MCWGIPISPNKRAFHAFGTEDGAATGKADGIKCRPEKHNTRPLRDGCLIK